EKKEKFFTLWTALELPPPFHGLEHGDFVGVFNIATNRNSHRNPRNFQSSSPQLSGQINRGRLTLNRRIGGNNHFIHLSVLHAPHQVPDPQLLRANSVQRRNGPVQNVISPVEVLSLFDGSNI